MAPALRRPFERRFNSDLPSIGADLVAGWQVGTATNRSTEISALEVEFKDIKLDLGDFIGNYIGPAIAKVQSYLEPVDKVLDVLTSPIPGVSDVSKLAGGPAITLLDLALIREPNNGAIARRFINTLDQITGIVDTINQTVQVSNGRVDINYGNLDLKGLDLTKEGWNKEAGDSSSVLTSAIDSAVLSFQSIEDQLSGNPLKSTFGNLQRKPDSQGRGGLGIVFDFLEPVNIFKFLIGQRANVITWDIPTFALDFPWKAHSSILPFPPITAGIGFDVGFSVHLAVGYDTRSMETKNFTDGFFFSDVALTGGKDIDELAFGLGVTIDIARGSDRPSGDRRRNPGRLYRQLAQSERRRQALPGRAARKSSIAMALVVYSI